MISGAHAILDPLDESRRVLDAQQLLEVRRSTWLVSRGGASRPYANFGALESEILGRGHGPLTACSGSP
jgi:hypothetical protein